MTKVEAIREVILSCGGSASLEQIYENIEKFYPKAKNSVEWEAGIRGVLYREIRNSQMFIKLDTALYGLKDVSYANNNIDEDITKIREQEIPDTEKEQLIFARRGQGLFRESVIEIDGKCKITDVSFTELLIASHIKPWRDCSNEERLDGNNGLLLSPHIDKIFDKYYISFSDEGRIIIYNDNIKEILKKWNINDEKKYYDFSKDRIYYLEYHRIKCDEKRNH